MTETLNIYPHTCRIIPNIATVDGAGETQSSDGTAVTGIQCHFQSRGSSFLAKRDTAILERDWAVFPDGTVIAANDQIDTVVDATTGAAIISGARKASMVRPFAGHHIEIEFEDVS